MQNRNWRRTAFAAVALTAGMTVGGARPALAADYPDHGLTLIVPYPTGSSADGVARLYAGALKTGLGQPVAVDNRTGAAGLLGHEAIAHAAPDGYTFGVVGQPVWTPKPLARGANFTAADFTPLGRFAAASAMIVVTPVVPAKNLRQLIAYARANPGRIKYGVVQGNLTQLDGVRFTQITKTRMGQVAFYGAAPMTQALLGHQIQMAMLTPTMLSQIKSGKFVALASAGPTRWAQLPDVPTAAEQDVPFESAYWLGFAGPANLPAPVVARLAAALDGASRTAAVRDGITATGNLQPIEPVPSEMTAVLKREIDNANEAAKALGLLK